MEIQQLAATPLFRGMAPEAITAVIEGLQGSRKIYRKDAFIFNAGEVIRHFGLVLTGTVDIRQMDAWGSEHILAQVGPGELFGESYACAGEPLGVTAAAAGTAEILFLSMEGLLACPRGEMLIRNLLAILARKNLTLNRKLSYLSLRSIRERVMAYLGDEAARQESSSFAIPFNRQQMADYLRVERSALSAELGRMRREGLIQFEKNHFTLEVSQHG